VSTNATRVVLADDEILMREGLAGLLERSGFEVMGQSGNASALIELVRELRPDLVIVDVRMPPTHTIEGVELVAELQRILEQLAGERASELGVRTAAPLARIRGALERVQAAAVRLQAGQDAANQRADEQQERLTAARAVMVRITEEARRGSWRASRRGANADR
jgi:DNA-binding NarL/FixJ family response regulator